MGQTNSDDDPWAFKSHLLNIIDQIESDITDTELSGGEDSTAGICHLLMGTVFDLIRSIYSIPCIGDTPARKTLLRSLTEYLVDLEYISLKNDESLNRLFTHYFLLIGYWQHTDKDDPLRTDSDLIIDEYKHYIMKHIDSLLPHSIKKTHLKSVPKKRTNLNKEIRLLLDNDPSLDSGYICTDLRLSMDIELRGEGKWSLIDSEIKKRYTKHWSGKSLAERYTIIAKHDDVNKSFQDQFYYRSFKFLSSFSHPTGFGTQAKHTYNSPSDKTGVMRKSDLIISEFDLLAAFETAVYAYCRHVDSDSRAKVWQRTMNLIDYSDKITRQRFILKETYNNMTSDS